MSEEAGNATSDGARKLQRRPSEMAKSGVICKSTLLKRPSDGAEDEAVRDLKRHLLAEADAEEGAPPPRASSLNLERDASDVMHPEIGTLSTLATPGGFRRNHVRERGGAGSHARTVLTQLLLPKVIFPGLRPEDGSPVSDEKVSNLSISIVILKIFMGSGFLVIPRGFANAGLVGGPLALFAMFCLEFFCMVKLIRVREGLGTPQRYEELAACWHPVWGPRFVWLVIFMSQIGFICIWIDTQAMNLDMLLPDWGLVTRLFAFLPLYAPIVCIRRVGVLAYVNLFGVVACFVSMVYLLYFSGSVISSQGAASVEDFNTRNTDWLLWVGATAYVYEGVNLCLPLYESVEDKKSFPKLLVGLSFLVTIAYIVFGVSYYLAFGDDTAQLATMNLPRGTFWGYALPLLFAFIGVGTNPLNIFLCFQMMEPHIGWSEAAGCRKWQKNAFRIGFTGCCFILTYIGGDELQNLLALVGGFCCALLALVIPSCLHLKYCKPVGMTRAVDYAIATIGCTVLVLSTGTAIVSWK